MAFLPTLISMPNGRRLSIGLISHLTLTMVVELFTAVRQPLALGERKALRISEHLPLGWLKVSAQTRVMFYRAGRRMRTELAEYLCLKEVSGSL